MASWAGVPLKIRWNWLTPTAARVEVALDRPARGQGDGGDGGQAGSRDWPRAGDTHLADHGEAGEQHDGQQHRQRHAAPGHARPGRCRPPHRPVRPSRASRRLFRTTITLDRPMATAATSGSRSPNAASGSAEHVVAHGPPEVLRRSPRRWTRPRRWRPGTPWRSLPSRATSLLASAASDPLPMAQPDLGRGQRRGVVDPVTDHHHPPAVGRASAAARRPCRPGSGALRGVGDAQLARPRARPPARCRR